MYYVTTPANLQAVEGIKTKTYCSFLKYYISQTFDKAPELRSYH